MNLSIEVTRCYHCGEENQNSIFHDRHVFCCQGCVGAYNIIQELGHGNYYQHREKFANKPKQLKTPRVNLDDYRELQTKEFYIEGIHCASCVWLNERVLRDLPGVADINISFVNNKLSLTWNNKASHLEQINARLNSLGYNLRASSVRGEINVSMMKRLAVAGFFAGNMMLISIALYSGFFSGIDKFTKNIFHFLGFCFSTPVLFYSARPLWVSAIQNLKRGNLVADFLTIFSLMAAYTYSIYASLTGGEVFFDAVTSVVFIILIGRYLEMKLKNRIASSIDRLEEKLPTELSKLEKNRKTETLVEDLKIGDRILIESGETFPIDCRLVSQFSEVSEVSITGEYQPIVKSKGDIIRAGSKVLGENIEAQVMSTVKQSSLEKMKQILQKNLHSDGENYARYNFAFVAGIFILSVGFFFANLFYFNKSLSMSIIGSITLLIVACPCAFNLAIPLARALSLNRALKDGLLIRNIQRFFDLTQVNSVVLDKTGTLTHGRFQITKVVAEGTNEKEYSLQLATEIEAKSKIEHPIRTALLSYSRTHSNSIKRSRYIRGKGMIARSADGSFYILGSSSLMNDYGISISKPNESRVTIVYLAQKRAKKTTLIAAFHLDDLEKPDSLDFIRYLKSQKKDVTVLTGDSISNEEYWKKKFEINDYYSQVGPKEKTEFIKRAKQRGNKVLMIGDGINDALALSTATTSFSFVKGSELATNSADVLLLQDSLFQFEAAFRLAKQTKAVIRQNLIFAILYNLTLIPIALLGFLMPLTAALFMSSSSLIVLLNSLRIKPGSNT